MGFEKGSWHLILHWTQTYFMEIQHGDQLHQNPKSERILRMMSIEISLPYLYYLKTCGIYERSSHFGILLVFPFVLLKFRASSHGNVKLPSEGAMLELF